MKIIEIVEPITDVVYLTTSDLEKMINEHGIMHVLSNYQVPEEFLLEKKFDKDAVLSCINPSEDFVIKALESEYLEVEDLNKLSTTCLSNLSSSFISSYKEHLDWNRMMLFLAASESIKDINEYQDIIEEKNLWEIISCENLPIDFIRLNKDKLNWNYLSICKDFTDDEKEEFKNYISLPIEYPIIENMDEIRTDDIMDMISGMDKESNLDKIKSLIGTLSPEEINQLKTTIK